MIINWIACFCYFIFYCVFHFIFFSFSFNFFITFLKHCYNIFFSVFYIFFCVCYYIFLRLLQYFPLFALLLLLLFSCCTSCICLWNFRVHVFIFIIPLFAVKAHKWRVAMSLEMRSEMSRMQHKSVK